MTVNAREAFRINLSRLMEERDLSQSEIAKILNVTSSTVSDWCNGKKYPRVDRMQKLAAIFHVPMSRLTGESAPVQEPLDLSSEEERMVYAYRGATEAAREIAFEVLINHQTVTKKERA